MENTHKHNEKCNHDHEPNHNLEEEKLKEQEEKQKINENIVTFSIGDEKHPISEDDEEIFFIGERIRALENLEICKNLKVRKMIIKFLEIIFEKKCNSENRKYFSPYSIRRVRII